MTIDEGVEQREHQCQPRQRTESVRFLADLHVEVREKRIGRDAAAQKVRAKAPIFKWEEKARNGIFNFLKIVANFFESF